MTRANFVKAARKDYPDHGIKKGDSYYWWKFRYGGKWMSKTRPRPSQLTQSEFLVAVYGAQENVEDAVKDFNKDSDFDALASALEDAAATIREQGESCLEKKDNMPEGLQEGDTGQLLDERADQCESLADELEQAASDVREQEPDGTESTSDEDAAAKIESAREEAVGLAEGVSWDF